jgi:hypothetical protein
MRALRGALHDGQGRRRRGNIKLKLRRSLVRRAVCYREDSQRFWPHNRGGAPGKRSSFGLDASLGASAQHHGGNAQDRKRYAHARAGRAGGDWGCYLLHNQAASGNSIRNVVPRPTSEVKSIEPL